MRTLVFILRPRFCPISCRAPPPPIILEHIPTASTRSSASSIHHGFDPCSAFDMEHMSLARVFAVMRNVRPVALVDDPQSRTSPLLSLTSASCPPRPSRPQCIAAIRNDPPAAEEVPAAMLLLSCHDLCAGPHPLS